MTSVSVFTVSMPVSQWARCLHFF